MHLEYLRFWAVLSKIAIPKINCCTKSTGIICPSLQRGNYPCQLQKNGYYNNCQISHQAAIHHTFNQRKTVFYSFHVQYPSDSEIDLILVSVPGQDTVTQIRKNTVFVPATGICVDLYEM